MYPINVLDNLYNTSYDVATGFKLMSEYHNALDVKRAIDNKDQHYKDHPLWLAIEIAKPREISLSAYNKGWQFIIREIRMGFKISDTHQNRSIDNKTILPDSLILMIAEYCVAEYCVAEYCVDVKWSEFIESRMKNDTLHCYNHCYYCNECDCNLWISIHEY
jgi:hypothetical protein